MTGDEIIAAFDALPTKAWRHGDQQAIIDGDDWTDQQVVKLSDVLEIVGRLVHLADSGWKYEKGVS